MTASQSTPEIPSFQLPVTGRREGQRVIICYTTVADDGFTASALAGLYWNINNHGYVYRRAARPSRAMILLHRVVFENYHGHIPDDKVVDHIDRNPLNNLPGNLRLLTHAQNISNQRRKKPSKYGFVGVNLVNKGCKRPWCGRIRANGKIFKSAYFATPEEAAVAVNELIRQHLPFLDPPNKFPTVI